QLIEADTTCWRSRLDRGRALARLGRRSEAEAELARALAQAPGEPEVWVERGGIFFDLGERERAAADFARAIDQGAGDPMVWYRRALVGIGTADTDADRRLRTRLLGRVLARKPEDPEPWIERAQLFLGLGQWRKATTDFTEAIERAPDAAEPWVGRGRCRAQLGQWDQATADFARAIELGTGEAFVW